MKRQMLCSYCNMAAIEMLGIGSVQSIKELDFLDLFSEADAQLTTPFKGVMEVITTTVRQGIHQFSCFCRNRINGKFPCELTFINALNNKEDKIIYCVLKDLSVQQRSELENKMLMRSLKASNDSLNAAALVSSTDLNGIITYVNEKFCQISGYSAEEMLGQPHRIVNSGKHTKEFWQELWATIKSGQSYKGEICNRAKDGSLYWVEATIIPVTDANNAIVGYTALRIDVTSKKETERQFQHQSKLASIGEMAAGVGHEINNPLAIGAGSIELIKRMLKQETITNPKIFDRIEKVEMANERIRKIVDGLRTYARSDSDQTEIVSMHNAIDQTLNLISEIYEGEGISISRNYPKPELLTRGNLGVLQQVIMNFMSNARDATVGQSSRKIELSLVAQLDNTLRFSVGDNGSGISDAIKDKIFEPFFTTKGVGKGTGLGLGIVSELVKKMGGELEFESVEGEGSSFSIVLPRCDSAADS